MEELKLKFTDEELEWMCFVNELTFPELLSKLYSKYRITVERLNNG